MLPVFNKLTPQNEADIRQVANAHFNGLGPNGTHFSTCRRLSSAFGQAIRQQQVSVPGFNVDVWESFVLHMNTQANLQCGWCGGWGHETKDCMTNILLTRTARNAGVGFHWGAIKGMGYFRDAELAMTVHELREHDKKPKVTVKVIGKKKARKK